MDKRMIEFISALRTLGVRVSVAESGDALSAIDVMGAKSRDVFQTSLRTTLVKDAQDRPTFDQLFPVYFGTGTPPLMDVLEDLTPDQKKMLAAALRALLEHLKNNPPQTDQEGQKQQGQSGPPMPPDQFSQLLQLLQALLSGQNPSQQDLDDVGQQVGLDQVTSPYRQNRMTRRMSQQMGMEYLDQILDQLWQALAEAGMSQEAINELRDMIEANREALAEQISQHVNNAIRRQNLEQRRERQQNQDITQRSFNRFKDDDLDALRAEMRRLAAQLRTRAALRQKRGKTGTLDVKRTIRRNMRNGNVPIELSFKRRHLKPKLTILCDISGSMYRVAYFMLNMIYQVQDQTTKTRSFAFYYNIYDISHNMHTSSVDEALEDVMHLMPHIPYATDLGSCLDTFTHDYFDAVDQRTTVIFLGDGRNNYNDPRLDCMDKIRLRAKQIIWLNPEYSGEWGTGDSDMLAYQPYCDAVHQVRNLAQLAEAIDQLLVS